MADLEERDEHGIFDFRLHMTGTLGSDQIMNISLQRAHSDLVGASYDTVTGLLTPTQYGRPNFRRDFSLLAGEHQHQQFSVYFCGPKKMSSSIRALCKEQRKSGTPFVYYHESFEQ